MGFGWGVGFNYSLGLWLKDGLKKSDLWKIFFGSFFFGWLGAKIFFLLFSAPDKALNYSMEVNFWLGGGFVFYGGLIFAAIFALTFASIAKTLNISDLANILPGLSLGHALGRIGCLLAGCCYGNHCDLPIAIAFRGVKRHPVQLYEAIALVCLFFLLRWILKKGKKAQTLLAYLIGYSVIRFVLEFFRGDEIRGSYLNLSTSQWISVGVISTTLLVIFIKRFKSR
jgi:phosphatidylglycerol:prolipoprotein diacylglycerol transferase